MSWTEIEIDESGKVTVRRGGTLTGETEVEVEPQPEPEPDPKLVTSWQECMRNHPWGIDYKPEHRYPIGPEPEPEPEPKPMVEPVVWRKCVRIRPREIANKTVIIKWYPFGNIPEHWYPIEASTQPVETFKQLPEGQQP